MSDELKHTPGPWTVRYRTNAYADIVKLPEAGRPLYEEQHIACTSIDNHEANARLIAGAPDLLAALIEARHALQFANDSPGGPIVDTIWIMHSPGTIFDFLDAAIAKATGGKE